MFVTLNPILTNCLRQRRTIYQQLRPSSSRVPTRLCSDASSSLILADQSIILDRTSHIPFLGSRDWSKAENFWTHAVKNSSAKLPTFVEGDEQYGVTRLEALYKAGMRGEFFSKDGRYNKRKTFALRIGYVGSKYNGYQQQYKVPGIYTVEDDLKRALGATSYGAGRTDRGVSAVSQVIGLWSTGPDVTSEEILERVRRSDGVQGGRLAAYECYRVPKKFNARSTATWRRYLYLLPLNTGNYSYPHLCVNNGNEGIGDGLGDDKGERERGRGATELLPTSFDIDVEFVNKALNK